MKHRITRFTSLKAAIEELKPFIRNGEHLQTGKRFKRMGGMLSREMLANWLVCVSANHASGCERFEFTSSPHEVGGDGIIRCTISGATWPTEHVLVPAARRDETRNAETRISAAIESKVRKGGAAYASAKTLIVFLNAGQGEWLPNRVARQLPQPLLFDHVWVVGLQNVTEGSYEYAVTRLDLAWGSVPIWTVRISPDFDDWEVRSVPLNRRPSES